MQQRSSIISLDRVSILIAVLVEPLLHLRWWHPSCAAENGDKAYATGFPFPYSQWTGLGDANYAVSIPLFILNIVIISAVLFSILYYLAPKLIELKPASGILKNSIFIILAVGAVLRLTTLYQASSLVSMIAVPAEAIYQYRPIYLLEATTRDNCLVRD